MARLSRFRAPAAILACALIIATAPATAAVTLSHDYDTAETGITPRGALGLRSVDTEQGFLQIRTDGQLMYQQNTTTGYTAHLLGSGWEGTTHIALLSNSLAFVDVTAGGILRLWRIVEDKPVLISNVMGGWGNTIAITGVGDSNDDGFVDFVQVNTAGELTLWRGGNATGFIKDYTLGYQWQNTRLLAGTSDQRAFVQVRTDNTLWSWTIPTNTGSYAIGKSVMGGWGNVRQLGPGGTGNSFTALRTDNQLIQWTNTTGTYRPINQSGTWATTRYLG